MIDLNSKSCTACGACVGKCPVGCLSLAADENGFLSPTLGEGCINCGACERACPIDKGVHVAHAQHAYAAVSNNERELALATSGGIFGAIAGRVLDMGGAVYGCAYVGHLKATHVRVSTREELSSLFGSKYVQSDTADTFRECKSDLDEGRAVLYSGTPCQIAGLLGYLGKSYDNLITVDIVCHGVASQAYFDKFISYLEESEGATCTDYSFRSKRNAGWSSAGMADFKTDTGREFSKKQYYFSNYYYYYYYHSCSIYRESCYTCEYARGERVGDITLGDLWGAEGLSLPFDTEGGTSLVITNTAAGEELFSKLDVKRCEIPMGVAVKYNHQLSHPSSPKHNRDELMRMYREGSARDMQNYFKAKNKKRILIAKIKYAVPAWLRRALLKLKYKK